MPEKKKAVRVLSKAQDPHGYPRPGPSQKHVPLRTSFYIELGMGVEEKADKVLPESVSIRLQPEGKRGFYILRAGKRFSNGYSGRVYRGRSFEFGKSLAVYAEPHKKSLRPATTYTVTVEARSRDGAAVQPEERSWSFTTEGEAKEKDIGFRLNLNTPVTRWQGGFFTGFCKINVCGSTPDLIPSYELMAEARNRYPKAWSIHRDFWMTGMHHTGPGGWPFLPNVVREMETRRIVSIEQMEDRAALRVEDFFGHEQYGIPSSRSLHNDYVPGDKVLIADGINHALAEVIATDDAERSVAVTVFKTPEEGWKTDYGGALPDKEDPHVPGFFPPGGCYLRKFHPGGTPRYYWNQLDKEWDLAHKHFGRRLMPNFADAPGDLSVDGRSWTTAKDYVELHEATHAFTSHIIERYGDACLDFPWSVFNEPDFTPLFWRCGDWDALQTFYDYTVDAILRAFEDHGYDSNKVFVGGLEIAAITGARVEEPILKKFLAHCSPTATAEGALDGNTAYADPALDGKRSRRVEELCRANGGKGTPCDFVSVHAYNGAKVMADKLIRAKELALEIDSEYYRDLWINSHECCPDWNPPPDPAAVEINLGNGFYATWCAEVARRQLAQAKRDSRYAFGETILTFWPWPNEAFARTNAATQIVLVDDNGDGESDRKATIPTPLFHFLTLLNGMGEDYCVLPEKKCEGHVISGFASRQDEEIQVLLYAHNPLDTQSRSGVSFVCELALTGLPWARARLFEYRFDKEHNTYFSFGKTLLDRPDNTISLDEYTRLMSLSTLASEEPRECVPSASHTVRITVKLAVNGSSLLVLRGVADSPACP